KVAALYLLVADSRLEDKRVIACVGRADFAEVGKVLKHVRDGCQECADVGAAFIGLEHDGAPEHDVIREQGDRSVQIPCFDGGSKRMHFILLDGSVWPGDPRDQSMRCSGSSFIHTLAYRYTSV